MEENSRRRELFAIIRIERTSCAQFFSCTGSCVGSTSELLARSSFCARVLVGSTSELLARSSFRARVLPSSTNMSLLD